MNWDGPGQIVAQGPSAVETSLGSLFPDQFSLLWPKELALSALFLGITLVDADGQWEWRTPLAERSHVSGPQPGDGMAFVRTGKWAPLEEPNLLAPGCVNTGLHFISQWLPWPHVLKPRPISPEASLNY